MKKAFHQKKPTKAVLQSLYVTKHLPIREIATIYGVAYGTARKWLLDSEIELRHRGGRGSRKLVTVGN